MWPAYSSLLLIGRLEFELGRRKKNTRFKNLIVNDPVKIRYEVIGNGRLMAKKCVVSLTTS